MKKYIRIVNDVILNLIATALPLIALQLLVLPLVARYLGGDNYGNVLALISVLTIICGSLGNSLNNIRLINSDSEDNSIEPYFRLLALIEVFLSPILVALIGLRYGSNIHEVLLLALTSILWTFREYIIVLFRLKLNFRGIVINNILMIIGYLVGFLLFRVSGKWQFIYIVGLLFSVLYVLTSNGYKLYPISLSHEIWRYFSDLLILVIATLMLNLLNYADRMLIYPMLGGTAVSIYYVSSLFGKVVSSAVSPLNSVVLSYLAKMKGIQRKSMWTVIYISWILAAIGYIMCNIFAMPLLNLVYPEFAMSSKQYVPIMTAVAMISMMSGVLSPFVLRFCKVAWQIVVNGVVLLVYIVSSVLLFNKYGLYGFCYGVLISNVSKYMIMLLLGIKMSGKA